MPVRRTLANLFLSRWTRGRGDIDAVVGIHNFFI
jgi:hypothetical protein